jgi:membrane-associated phospholipid phosphatase
MTLLLLLIFSLATFCTVTALSTWRSAADRTAPRMMGMARAASRRDRGQGTAIAKRLDPQAATGLALTLALLLIAGAGVLLGVLAYLVRGDTSLVRLDNSVATWGDRHASPFSTDILNAITHLGAPSVIVGMAAILAIAETLRTRSKGVVPFLLIVVAGNGILTTTVKDLVDRVRPALDPAAETLGPSFPSGHSSWSAAFFAAAALLLGRGRSRHARATLAGAAAGLTVMVAGSRVLLGVHWLTDVIAGLVLGSAWFSICAVAFAGRLLRFGAVADEAAQAASGQGGMAAKSP